MNSQKRVQGTNKPNTILRRLLREGLETGTLASSTPMPRLRGKGWLRSVLTCSAFALAVSGTGLVDSANAQLRLDAEAEAPQDPTPFALSGAEADAWDMDEEFEEVDGVTPLLRGPMHEAYAERFTDDDEDPVVISKAPPELIDEQPPEVAPDGENFVWIPGYWGWDLAEEDFVWVSGVWRKVPPKHQWIPGYWAEIEGGWQWISGFWTTAAEENIVYLPQPPETLDVGPSSPAPGDNYFWIPGCWNFTSGNYSWRSGYWGAAQNDWVWMPNRYVWTPSGYIFRRGYWDYRLPNRGVVFAPVHFRPGFHGVYRPAYTIQVNPLLLANMFIAPGFSQYYYGNYHGYSGHRHMHSWTSYYRHGYDPFLSYYAHQRRHEKWLHDLNRLGHHIAVTPHLQSQIRVADQFRHRHDMLRQPHSIDTLMRVSNAKRLVSSAHPSFKPPVTLKLDRDVREKYTRDKFVDPMRDFERKRRDLERAENDIDRERAKRLARDIDRGRVPVGPGDSGPKGPGPSTRDSIELKQLKLGGRDDFRGRPGIPRDLQVDRKTERVVPTDRAKIPTIDRDKARESRMRDLDRVLGTKPDEKITPEQLRDMRSELLGNRRPPGSSTSPGRVRPDAARPDVVRPELSRPVPGRPDVGRPDRPSIERPLSDRVGGPDRGPERGTVRPSDLFDRSRLPQSDRRTGERLDPNPSTRPSTRPSPRPEIERPSRPVPSPLESGKIERPNIERPRIERQSEGATRPSVQPPSSLPSRVQRPQLPNLPSSDALRDRIRTSPSSPVSPTRERSDLRSRSDFGSGNSGRSRGFERSGGGRPERTGQPDRPGLQDRGRDRSR